MPEPLWSWKWAALHADPSAPQRGKAPGRWPQRCQPWCSSRRGRAPWAGPRGPSCCERSSGESRNLSGCNKQKCHILMPICTQALVFFGIDLCLIRNTSVHSWTWAERHLRVDTQHYDVLPQVPGAHHPDYAAPLGFLVQLLLQFWKETWNTRRDIYSFRS